MDTNDEAIKKTELVIDALDYAHSNNLDINNEVEVEKILNAIDPERSIQIDIEEFMKLLQAANTLIEKDVERRRSMN